MVIWLERNTMHEFAKSMKKLLGTHFEDPNAELHRASVLALMAATVHNFIDVMLQEIEIAGFTGPEYLEKAVFFLKITTPSYEESKFQQVLTALVKVDESFPETRFYNGLETLRALVSGRKEGYSHLAVADYRHVTEILEANPVEMVFFTCYLVENLYRYINSLRLSSHQLPTESGNLKKLISGKFDEIVLHTVNSINNPKNAN